MRVHDQTGALTPGVTELRDRLLAEADEALLPLGPERGPTTTAAETSVFTARGAGRVWTADPAIMRYVLRFVRGARLVDETGAGWLVAIPRRRVPEVRALLGLEA